MPGIPNVFEECIVYTLFEMKSWQCNVTSFQIYLGSRGDLDYARWAVLNHIMYFCSVVYSDSKTSPHLLWLGRWLQQRNTAECFVDHETSLYFPSAWRWDNVSKTWGLFYYSHYMLNTVHSLPLMQDVFFVLQGLWLQLRPFTFVFAAKINNESKQNSFLTGQKRFLPIGTWLNTVIPHALYY